jgi:FkbH-like protein
LLKNDRTELDYSRLVKRARLLPQRGGAGLKVALLADVSTQHLAPLLKVLFHDNSIEAELYEAGYDTVELEAFDPSSALYAFEPDLVVIIQSIWKLKSAYYEFNGGDTDFSSAHADKAVAVWRAIQSRIPAQVIQSTYVVPYERPFGSYGLKVPDTLQGAVKELNRELGIRAQSLPSVFLNDVDYLAAWVGRQNFLDEKMWALSKALCAFDFLPHLAQSIVDIGLAVRGRAVKCVVLDLDNTLWGGVIGDDGLEGIGLGDLDDGSAFRFFQLYLRELSRRGIVLAVCSKNNEAIARKVFKEHPDMVLKEEHIAVFVANWDDKATNIRYIRDRLNIGFDSMVFLDDNPFERNLVRQLIPDVIVPELPEDPALYVRAVSDLNLFETASFSTLDSQRNELYQVQQKREEEKEHFVSLNDYLKSLETKVVFKTFELNSLSRISQLIQRSNQFNLTTRRYSEVECSSLMNDDKCIAFSVTVRDRFGDFGLVNVVILRKLENCLEIDTFLMSCRVLQRGIEQYAMNKIFEIARSGNFDYIKGRYIPTNKNVMVKNFFDQYGFELLTGGDDGEDLVWGLPVSKYTCREVFVEEISD